MRFLKALVCCAVLVGCGQANYRASLEESTPAIMADKPPTAEEPAGASELPTTVELVIDEVGQYSPTEVAAYSTRLGRAWQASLGAMFEAAKDLLLALVFLAPWLVLVGVAGLIVGVVWWRTRRPRKLASSTFNG